MTGDWMIQLCLSFFFKKKMTPTFLLLVFLLFFLTAAESKKIIRTVAGISPFAGDGKLAIHAKLNKPFDIFVSHNKEVYVADSNNHIIRKIDKNGIISTIAGIPGRSGFSGDRGPALSAQFNQPRSVIVTTANELYISDTFNNAIRKIFSNGTIVTVAGGNGMGNSGDGDIAINARLNGPHCALYTPWNDELLICDSFNNRIRKVFSNGTMTTVAGMLGLFGFSGDGGDATKARLYNPSSVFVTEQNELYIADSTNNRIRKVFQNGTISSVAGIGSCVGSAGDGGIAMNARLCTKRCIYQSNQRNVYC